MLAGLQVIKKLEAMLERLETISSDHPPLAASQRFGNLAFRTYAQQLQQVSFDPLCSRYTHNPVWSLTLSYDQELPDLIAALLPPSHAHLQPLLLPLLADTSAFGNSTRLDYGTGHELAFFLFLYALRASDVLTEGDDEAVVLRVFPKVRADLFNSVAVRAGC
jgi:serine/threonine-protein phosphatase 2A activator